MTTADMNIRYLRPIRQGTAYAVPRMLRNGRRAMVMQVDVLSLRALWEEDGLTQRELSRRVKMIGADHGDRAGEHGAMRAH